MNAAENTVLAREAEPVEPPNAISIALRRLMQLEASRLDAAIKDSDARIERLASAATAVATDARELAALVPKLDAADQAEAQQARARIRHLATAVLADVQATIASLQFYDRLVQRVRQVQDGLATSADPNAVPAPSSGLDWTGMRKMLEHRTA